MPTSISYELESDPAPAAATATAAAGDIVPNAGPVVTARGLLLPFRRNQRDDFANGTGRALWQANVELLLSTDGPTPNGIGEIPWRPMEGTMLRLLRHKNNTSILRGMAEVYIRQAFQRSFPGVLRLTRVDKFRPEPGVLRLEVAFDVVSPDAPIERNITAEVAIPAVE
jgi:hypothetical protein